MKGENGERSGRSAVLCFAWIFLHGGGWGTNNRNEHCDLYPIYPIYRRTDLGYIPFSRYSQHGCDCPWEDIQWLPMATSNSTQSIPHLIFSIRRNKSIHKNGFADSAGFRCTEKLPCCSSLARAYTSTAICSCVSTHIGVLTERESSSISQVASVRQPQCNHVLICPRENGPP